MRLSSASLIRDRLSITYLVFGTALSAAYFVVPASANVQHVIYQAIGLSAVFAIWLGNKRHRSGRAWSAILVGIVLWVAGDGYWNAYHWLTGSEAPFPSTADVLYL
ncbi:MAG: hypothetical protein ACXVY5_09760, partial [Gaiellales bacterium]